MYFVLVEVVRWRLQFFKRFHLKMGQNTKNIVLWMRSGSVTRLFRYRQDQFFNLH